MLAGHLQFLLNKLQTDEELKIVQKEESKIVEEHLKEMISICEELRKNVIDTAERNREILQDLRDKQADLDAANMRIDSLQCMIDDHEEHKLRDSRVLDKKIGLVDKESQMAEGRLMFFAENNPSLGVTIIKGKRDNERDWLERSGCNIFLKKAMKSSNTQESLIQKIAEMLGAAMIKEEDLNLLKGEHSQRGGQLDLLARKNTYLHQKLSSEEEIKRRTLLRYVHAVRAASSVGQHNFEKERSDIGLPGAGRLHIPESCLEDEEVHIIAALLKNNTTIAELNLRNNCITNDGARALAEILAGRSALRFVDLRGNRIDRTGIRAISNILSNQFTYLQSKS